jgi:hypothetical protein
MTARISDAIKNSIIHDADLGMSAFSLSERYGIGIKMIYKIARGHLSAKPKSNTEFSTKKREYDLLAALGKDYVEKRLG